MNEPLCYRHELKYDIAAADYLVLRQRLRLFMKSDPHTGSDGRYVVTSLYFDNCNDKALREKIDGVSRREKFRLRHYNRNLSRITLEKKQKNNNLCLKTIAPIAPEDCRALLSYRQGWIPQRPSGLLHELDFQMKSQLLRPRAIVAYTREPYIYGPGNVRVTFDMDIRGGASGRDFLNAEASLVPAMETGRLIMEVKYDDFLPALIADLLQTGTARAGAFSKYAACRVPFL